MIIVTVSHTASIFVPFSEPKATPGKITTWHNQQVLLAVVDLTDKISSAVSDQMNNHDNLQTNNVAFFLTLDIQQLFKTFSEICEVKTT